jgi:hypothetical protein
LHPVASLRRGDWIQTYTGQRFYPLDPRPDEIDITDIAHSLSLKCRFGGHCDRFYSVAEHSVLVYRHVGTLEGLMHDAEEAYSPFGDVPRPVKASIPWLKDISEPIEEAIAGAFNLIYPWPESVKIADNRIIADEKAAVFQNASWDWPYEPLGARIMCWPPFFAERMFLQSFNEAVAGR